MQTELFGSFQIWHGIINENSVFRVNLETGEQRLVYLRLRFDMFYVTGHQPAVTQGDKSQGIRVFPSGGFCIIREILNMEATLFQGCNPGNGMGEQGEAARKIIKDQPDFFFVSGCCQAKPGENFLIGKRASVIFRPGRV